MKTTHTSGQLLTLLKLLEQKGMVPENFQFCLEGGILADVIEAAMITKFNLQQRSQIRDMLGLVHKEVIFKEIELDAFKTYQEKKNAMKEAKSVICTYAERFLIDSKIEKGNCDLVVRSVERLLGEYREADYAEICRIALSSGLDYCGANAALQLRLRYMNQPKDEKLIVASNEFGDSDGEFMLLNLCCSQVCPLLAAEEYTLPAVFGPKTLFVFMRRK